MAGCAALESSVAKALSAGSQRHSSEMGGKDLQEAAERVVYRLSEGDPTRLGTDEELGEEIHCVLMHLHSIQQYSLTRLVGALSDSTSILSSALSNIGEETEDIDSFRKAFRGHVAFLAILVESFEIEGSPETQQKDKKDKASANREFQWEKHKAEVMERMRDLLEADLVTLFKPSTPDAGLMRFFLRAAVSVLTSSGNAMRSKNVKNVVFDLIIESAMKFSHVEQAASSLFQAMATSESVARHVADIASTSLDRHEQKFIIKDYFVPTIKQDPSFANALLQEICMRDPKDYERQASADSIAVRSAGVFFVALSEKRPEVVVKNASLLLQHIDTDVPSLRSSIVSALGNLIMHIGSHGEGMTTQAIEAHLRTKQSLFEHLGERVHDASYHVRARVMQTWGTLVENRCLTIGNWISVFDLARGRLFDKTSMVRKAALKTIGLLLQYNPFAPALPTPSFESTLEEYQCKLSEATRCEGREENCEETAESGNPLDDARGNQEAEQVPDNDDSYQPEGGSESLRSIVASLEVATAFAQRLRDLVPVLCSLLDSSTSSDVIETVALIVIFSHFQIDNTIDAMRKMFALVFSRDQQVRDSVLRACESLFMAEDDPFEIARTLISLVTEAPLGSRLAVENILYELVNTNALPMGSSLVQALLAFASGRSLNGNEEARGQALELLSYIASAPAGIHQDKLSLINSILHSALERKDGPTCRWSLTVFKRCSQWMTVKLPSSSQTFACVKKILSVNSSMEERSWFPCAEVAIDVVYAFHPSPEAFLGNALSRFVQTVANNKVGESTYEHLARVMFLAGHVAIRHCAYCERQARLARDSIANPGNGEHEEDKDDEGELAAQLGAEPLSAESQVEEEQKLVQSEILGYREGFPSGIIASLAPVVVDVCQQATLMKKSTLIRGCALGALVRMMAVDGSFCERNLGLLFTKLRDESDAGIRSTLVVSLGDLAFKFPNVVEPWTKHLYGIKEWGTCLYDRSDSVRKHALTVLSHLVLNDMMKVRSHISGMALCLADANPYIASLANIFFTELSKKTNNPIYNLLPDLLSNLSNEESINEHQFRSIMRSLISLIDKEKQGEQLVRKICGRICESVAKEDMQMSRSLAYCISQLPLGERGFRRLEEAWKQYEWALHDEYVASCLKEASQACKKKKQSHDKQKQELNNAVDEFVQRIDEAHANLAEAYDNRKCEKEEEGGRGQGEETFHNWGEAERETDVFEETELPKRISPREGGDKRDRIALQEAGDTHTHSQVKSEDVTGVA